MSLPSASSLKRAMSCAASMVLPRVQSENEAAAKGNAVHEYLYNCSKMDPAEAMSRVPAEYQELCAAIELDSLPPLSNFKGEVTFAYDVETDTCMVLGENLGRAYDKAAVAVLGRPLKESEIVGTADLAGHDPDAKTVAVLDYKTGRSRLDPAEKNWQLKFLVLAAARAWNAQSGTAQLGFIREGEAPFLPKPAEFTALDLDLIAADLKGLHARYQAARKQYAENKTVQPVTGDHCRYCPSADWCPAQTMLVRRLAGEKEEMIAQFQSRLTAENLPKAIQVLQQIDEIKKRGWASVYRFVEQNGPVDMGNGQQFGSYSTEEDSLNPNVVREVLGEMFDSVTADRACAFDTSKAAIERAIKEVVPKGKGAAAVRAALGEISRRGGITTQTKVKRGLFDANKGAEKNGNE